MVMVRVKVRVRMRVRVRNALRSTSRRSRGGSGSRLDDAIVDFKLFPDRIVPPFKNHFLLHKRLFSNEKLRRSGRHPVVAVVDAFST
jgi:hypothetical protein